MINVLIVYTSHTGNTKKMAEIIAESATTAGATVLVRPAHEATNDELAAADAVVLGSPTYYGHSSGEMRHFIDHSVKLHGKLEGKVGAAFASSHNIGGGNETTILDLLHALLIHGMVIQGNSSGDHYGPVAIGAPDARATRQCEELGCRVVALAARLQRA